MKATLKTFAAPAFVMTIFAITCLAQAPQPPSQPSPSPQVKQTVDAVSGHWAGQMTASLPGLKPESFPWEMTCNPAALGAGAACSMKGMASIGAIEEACLFAYDPDGKAVHFMCITSMAEVHDHKGQWISEHEIRFDPYPTSWEGKPATEDVNIRFPDPTHIQTSSVITKQDGSKMTFEFHGIRN
jgi:hypothetical protein